MASDTRTSQMKILDETIKQLTDYAHARLRTQMWLGSTESHVQQVLLYNQDGQPELQEITYVPALFTAFREILDNSLDEIITRGFGDRIDITYHEASLTFSIADNGRGIPIDKDKKTGLSQATVALTSTKAGRNFGERGSSRGQNGVGASIVVMCSENTSLIIHRDGKIFEQNFSENKGKGENLVVEDPIIFPTKKKDTGTKIICSLSKKVFKTHDLPDRFVKARVQDVALAYPHLKLTYNGQKVQIKSNIEKVLFPNYKPVIMEFQDADITSKFWLVPLYFEGTEHTHSIVNGIPVFNGGSHIDQFRKGFFSGLLTALGPMAKKRKLEPNRSDASEGMLIFNITEMDTPSFDSQSKSRLINKNIEILIKSNMDDPDFFKKIIRNYPDYVEAIFERCMVRTQKKDDKDLAKLAKKRVKVEKLTDACGLDRSKCSIFLCEGDSAVGGAVDARDPEIHGALPLYGKLLNVYGESLTTIAQNKVLSEIINSLGLAVGQRANRHTLRYGKVLIACDADEDGYSICALLVNFFYTLWPELFDSNKPPFIHIFNTPLIIAKKGKQAKYWYAENAYEFDPETYKGWEITRAKGLAALKKDDWSYCLQNPEMIPVIDDGNLKEALDLLFNHNRADDRKDWLGISN